QRRFAVVAAAAVNKKEYLLGHVARKRVADGLLNKCPQVSVIACDAFQELFEQRALGVAVCIHRSDFGQQISRIVLLATTRPQVDGAVLDVEQPWISIKSGILDSQQALGQV